MKRVTGIGGIFFKCKDPDALRDWYAKHLGIPVDEGGYVTFAWGEEKGHTVWSPFEADTDYFAPSKRDFLINYRVEDLDAVLRALRDEGVEVEDKTEDGEFGKFGWLMDPEGNKIELWQPPENF
ncbi:MAG: VOC family protein [Verrucomicrobiales bacterium]|nr:VOC family protein [Verrucomicrobiales bacterium]